MAILSRQNGDPFRVSGQNSFPGGIRAPTGERLQFFLSTLSVCSRAKNSTVPTDPTFSDQAVNFVSRLKTRNETVPGFPSIRLIRILGGPDAGSSHHDESGFRESWQDPIVLKWALDSRRKIK